jgi:hypothetical protein
MLDRGQDVQTLIARVWRAIATDLAAPAEG